MADFGQTEIEVKNELNPEDNKIVIADGVDPNLTATVNSNGELKVVVTGGGSAGQLVENGDVSGAGDVGRILVGFDGTNYRFISLDTSGRLQVDIVSSSLPTGAATETTLATLLTEATFSAEDFATETTLSSLLTELQLKADLTETQPVSVASLPLPAGAATEATLATLLTEATFSAKDFATQTTLAAVLAAQLPDGHNVTVDNILSDPLPSQITDGTDVVDILDDSGVGRLRVEAKIAAGGATQDVHPVDDNNVNLDVVLDVTRPANTRAQLFAGIDESDVVRVPFVIEDSEDGINRMAVQGKISISAPTPPAASTPVTIAADTPLAVSGTNDTIFEITTGETLTIQQITAGAEGDPTEKGAVIRVAYLDGAGTAHIIEQIYLTGQTVQVFPDTSTARDGTPLLGVAGVGLGAIRVRREQFGGGSRELDVVVRGFEQ